MATGSPSTSAMKPFSEPDCRNARHVSRWQSARGRKALALRRLRVHVHQQRQTVWRRRAHGDGLAHGQPNVVASSLPFIRARISSKSGCKSITSVLRNCKRLLERVMPAAVLKHATRALPVADSAVTSGSILTSKRSSSRAMRSRSARPCHLLRVAPIHRRAFGDIAQPGVPPLLQQQLRAGERPPRC